MDEGVKDGAFNIAKDTLQEIKIGECRLMHSLTDNVHGITYVWSSESEVLESTYNAAKVRRTGPMIDHGKQETDQ